MQTIMISGIATNPGNLLHILLSILAVCILCVAGLLAVLLALQENLLRYGKISFFIHKLPPLESMEKLLFQVIFLGFILLSMVLITSFYSYGHILLQHTILMQKTFLALFAWTIFIILLIGRNKGGWRGKKAIYYTLSGTLLLFIVLIAFRFAEPTQYLASSGVFH